MLNEVQLCIDALVGHVGFSSCQMVFGADPVDLYMWQVMTAIWISARTPRFRRSLPSSGSFGPWLGKRPSRRFREASCAGRQRPTSRSNALTVRLGAPWLSLNQRAGGAYRRAVAQQWYQISVKRGTLKSFGAKRLKWLVFLWPVCGRVALVNESTGCCRRSSTGGGEWLREGCFCPRLLGTIGRARRKS